ncbi:hypothetical protein HPP92_000209 [Vanilla planifolia]|uniref:Uncharacterized protein n=2 Tax=Vanilla planifolia TaxID=51239 RepID=A0A835VIH8_VANPL|nr:hypothetical protein HPP92_000209 [Vanilla planifolia]
MVGIHMQRAMATILLASIPLSFLLAFSSPILVLLRQVPEISMAAQSYTRWMIPSLLPFGLLQCHFKFLQAQNIVFPILFSSGATALFHCLFCWVLVHKSGLGFRGAALSVSASSWVNLLQIVIYVNFSSSCKATWAGFSREALHGLGEFLKLAVPSTVMICLQAWQFELLMLLSGLLPNPKLQTSVMSITQNTCALVYMIPYGISAAISTRVSNELGAANPKAAKLAIFVAASTIIAEGLVTGSTLIVARNLWGHAYSSDRIIVKAVASMMPWIALSHCIDGLQCVLQGTVRGCGRQKIGACLCLGSYYVVGIPASVLLGFVFHIGRKGLWIGNICAIFVQDLMLLIITILTNWEKQVAMARERVQSSVIPSNSA